ncbi:MAG: hypothetical protein K9N55_17580 [Phycisphaerae bacterium]|nr:hypothetical protein [Phycisphaerae bacterium]
MPEFGSDWWPYEQTAYYLDGALRCGYLNRSDRLIHLARRNLWTVLGHTRADGSLVPKTLSADTPIMAIFFHMALEEYENTQDVNILTAIERHYRALPGDFGLSSRRPGACYDLDLP